MSHVENELASVTIQTIWTTECRSHCREHVVNTAFTPRLASNFLMDAFLHFLVKKVQKTRERNMKMLHHMKLVEFPQTSELLGHILERLGELSDQVERYSSRSRMESSAGHSSLPFWDLRQVSFPWLQLDCRGGHCCYHHTSTRIQYKSTQTHSNADGLSRLPVKTDQSFKSESMPTIFNIHQIVALPVTSKQIAVH